MTAAPAGAVALSGGCRNSRNPPRRAHDAAGIPLPVLQVVSKCALREKKEEGPRFPGDLPADSIVLRQLLHQVILQRRQLHRLHFRQHLFQNCTLLNEPASAGFSLLDAIPRLCFLQSVLRLQQLLFRIRHVNILLTSASARRSHSPARRQAGQPRHSAGTPAEACLKGWKRCQTSRVRPAADRLPPA